MALTIDPATLSPSGWWKADALSGVDGSLVASWTDSSGNARHLTQATDSLKPKLRLWQDANYPGPAGGTHKAVRFDGTDDFLQSGVNLSTFLGTNGVGTIITVLRFQKNVTPSASAYGIFGVNAATGTKLSLRYDYTPEVFEAQNNDGAPDTALIAAPENSTLVQGRNLPPVAPATRIIVWRHDTALGKIQVAVDNFDDAAFVSTTSGATSDLANALFLGRTFEHYWYGDIFEVIAFPTVLTEANLRGVSLWLTEKYGLPYESGIASESNPAVTMRVEMKLPTSGLSFQPTLWLKADAITGLADSDPVATWPDSSGNGYDAAQGTPGNQPLYKTGILNGKPAVLFDGSTDYLSTTALLSAFLAGGGAGTVYVVARANSPGGEPDQTLWRDTGGTVHLTVVESGADVLRASNDDGVQDTVTKAYTLGTWMIGLWRHHQDERGAETPTELYVGVNDLLSTGLSSVASGATTAAILGNAIEIGRGSGYLNGYIAELLFFPKSHTQPERKHVWSYLAAKYALTYPESEYEPIWQDVTPDVRSAKGMRFRRGMEGPDVQDRVAGRGELQLVLENSTENSAGLQGYYSPHNANLRSGFRVGTPIRIVFAHYGTAYYKWQGWIINLRALPGKLMEREVVVRAGDWMDYAGRVTLSGLAIETDKRADQLMASLWVNSPRIPESIYFNKASDVYSYGLDNTEDEGILILREIHRLTLSELGYSYIRGDTVGGGQLRFEARGVRAGSVLRWAMTETELETRGLELSDHGLDGMINRVLVELHPRRVDAGTSTVLFSLGNAPLIGATPVSFNAPYRDPDSGRYVRVGGINMVTPVATTDYTLNTQADGGGTDLTANFSVTATFGGNAALITVTKNSGADGYLTKCQLRGRGVYAFESVIVDLKDDASILKYGQMSQRIDMPYQSDVNLANTVAALVLANNKEPRTKVRKVRFTANMNSVAMMQALTRDIGDRISVSESVSGLSAEQYFIHAIDFQLIASSTPTARTIIKTSWLLVPADQEAY